MTNKEKLLIWLLVAAALCFFIYSVSSILLPFIVAIILAYILNPLVDRIERACSCSRQIATSAVTALFFAIAIAAIILLMPVFYNQLLTFLHVMPSYVEYVNSIVLPFFSGMLGKVDAQALEAAKSSLGSGSGYVVKLLAGIVTNLMNSGMAALNVFSIIIITPIVTFYMLRDWHKVLSGIGRLIPAGHSDLVITQAREIDKILAAYIRGQTQVCLLVGVFYAIGLTLVGLQFSVFIGIATGLLLFIPYVGMFLGGAAGVIVAFFQFGDIKHVAIVAGIFAVGQIIEGAFITPNLVGNKVGLHPVWIIFCLLAGGAIFGFVGILLAVPVAAVIGVLVRGYVARIL